MLHFLGLSKSNAQTFNKCTPARGLPASWYHSSKLFQLERRAIFSKKWILLTHSLRFLEAGDFISFTYADFPFFLVRGRDGRVRCFHNACRHRAYPIVQKSSGNEHILSCKYHGWSYGFTGDLAKAPRFDTVEDFDKSQHSLYPIHVHVDRLGFIWVNLQAERVDNKWEDDFGGVDQNERLTQFQFTKDYSYSHVWELSIDANWKTVMENYNECYHCPTSHPLIAGVSDISKYRVDVNKCCLEHTIINKKTSDKEDEFRRSITFFYPSTSVTAT
ncbi:hypothetical protein QQS21_007901 [Conoideocrella luteorostrata]|uniref:Choline monooxygenase, chloroplastic n=1 Tax=Conoideocrella luteorostrata TaxID=1105319 RepID=A0AAJ0CJV3_9HYPO|nr:hypothetical protein QQS21_007901 [Conoideocrella luteorostrata]